MCDEIGEVGKVHLGDAVQMRLRVLDLDAKRIHYWMELVHAEERWLSIALGFLRPLQNAGLHSKVDCVEIAEQRAIEALYVMLTASVTPPSVPAAVATDHQATPTTANLPALPTAPTPATSAPATSTPTPTLPNSIEARVQRAVTVSRGVWKVLRDSKERLADVLRDRPSTPPSG